MSSILIQVVPGHLTKSQIKYVSVYAPSCIDCRSNIIPWLFEKHSAFTMTLMPSLEASDSATPREQSEPGLLRTLVVDAWLKALAHYNRQNTNYNSFYNCNDYFNSFLMAFRKTFAIFVVVC